MEGIDKAAEELNTAWQAASQHIYNAQQQAGAEGAPQQEHNTGNDDVVDAEVVEETK
jgi:molecular chaperone DnaK